MKKIGTIIIALFISTAFISAQDTLYMYKAGVVMSKRAVADIDSVTFSKTYTAPTTGTLSDIDGNIYHSIKIGSQTWMVENLKVSKYRTGESITNITDATAWTSATYGAWCHADNDSANGIIYGKLYNWYAASDARNIAPTGWHVATDTEWTTLENYLIANGGNYDGTTTGNKIGKSLASKTNWITYTTLGSVGNNSTLNNSSGFSALPGRLRNSYGSFYFGRDSGYWWCNTQYDNATAWIRNMNYTFSDLSRSSLAKMCGLSVRCVKD